MRLTIKGTIFALSLSISTLANAAFVSSDWLVEEDGKASLDTKTGLEWLSLAETKNLSINQALSMTREGQVFEGWRLPTSYEVHTMLDNLYPDFDLSKGNINQRTDGFISSKEWIYQDIYQPFVDTFDWVNPKPEPSSSQSYSYQSSRALYLSESGEDPLIAGVLYYRSYKSGRYSHSATLEREGTESWLTPSTGHIALGVYLVSDGGTTLSSRNAIADVPAPALIGALSLCLLGLSRRKKLA